MLGTFVVVCRGADPDMFAAARCTVRTCPLANDVAVTGGMHIGLLASSALLDKVQNPCLILNIRRTYWRDIKRVVVRRRAASQRKRGRIWRIRVCPCRTLP